LYLKGRLRVNEKCFGKKEFDPKKTQHKSITKNKKLNLNWKKTTLYREEILTLYIMSLLDISAWSLAMQSCRYTRHGVGIIETQ
jgi:hypothetical protein